MPRRDMAGAGPIYICRHSTTIFPTVLLDLIPAANVYMYIYFKSPFELAPPPCDICATISSSVSRPTRSCIDKNFII